MGRSRTRRRAIILTAVAGTVAGNPLRHEPGPAAHPTSGSGVDDPLGRPLALRRPRHLRPGGGAGTGRRQSFLRLEDLRTSNGPDLFVYLSTAAVDAPRDTFDDDDLSLGRLRANQGNQNYAIPAGVALDRYQSVVIWCRRFTYAFGAAALE